MTDYKEYYLYVCRPDVSHERDTLNGLVYRFICVADGKPLRAWWLQDRFENSEHRSAWSWGNGGIKARTVFEADDIARAVLGDQYAGRIE